MRNEASDEYSIPSKSAAQNSEANDESRGNNDQSLIYELMQKKEGKQIKDQRVEQIHRRQERISSNNDIQNESSEYGQLLEVNELFVKDENYNRQIIKKFHEHVEDEHKIKVFIDPNPPKKIELTPIKQTPQKIDPIKQQKLAQNQAVKGQMRIDLKNLNKQQPSKRNDSREKIIKEENVIEDFLGSEPNQQKRSNSKDLRIREITRLKNAKKEDVPATTRKRTTVSRQSDNSSRRRDSNRDSSDQMDSFDEFKEYKRKKKQKGVKTLIRKVQSLEKKVKQLKMEKQELQKMKIISKIIPPAKNKQYGIASNLISIKVETDNLLIKEDIMSELKKLKEKVEHLDNKTNERSRPIDHYESLSPANMAESKLQQTNNLIYSQTREKNKMTGKIFKKSDTKSSGLNEKPNDEQYKEARENIKQQTIPLQAYDKQDRIANISEITQQKPRSAIQISREMQKNRKPIESQSKKAEQSHIPNSHFQEQSKESFVPAGLKKTSSEMPINQKHQDNNQHKQRLIQNRQKRKQLQHKQHSPKPQKTQAQQARGFVRSGFRANNTTPTKAKQEDDKSLKMLEFDTGKEKFMVDSHNTQEDIRFTKGASKEISNFQAAAQLIPNVPSITKFPNYDTSEEQLVQMGKELFNVFGVSKINDDQTVLKVKKYKNCTYFGIDSTSNILLHYQGRIYFGGWKEFMNGQGEKSGDGVEYQEAKFLYKGQFRDGKRNGQGILKVNNSAQKSSIYIGQFIDGMKHGQGKQFDENGVKYQGQWKEGKKDGFGKLVLGLNEKYEGTFEKGLKNGHGTQFFKNGDKYQGQYLAGKFHGKGSYYWSNGSIYEGQFKNGMRNGKGIWRSNNNHGDIYEGQYENDMKHGYGIYNWANGSSYQGNFSKDQKHGAGKLTHQNGKVSNLQWDNGNVVAKASDQAQVTSNTNIRNYSKSLPINKNVYASKQRQRQKVMKNQNPIINNEMLKTLKSSSVSNMPKGMPQATTHRPFNYQQRNQESRPQPFMKLYEMTERPMTSKSMSSISNNQFRIERKSVGNGLPKDPPYRGIRQTNNIINF